MKISCYILTHNSERRLREALQSLDGIADELIIVDSGSTDQTLDIANQFPARVIAHAFEDFTSQRNFALAQCQHTWVFTIDSDEVLSPGLRNRLRALKDGGLRLDDGSPDAFGIRREWIVLGRSVHCFYPSRCPDAPVRLFRKDHASYVAGRRVHETLRGFNRSAAIEEPLLHYSCDSIDDLYGKLGLYATLAAQDLVARHGRPGVIEACLMPWIVAFRWYVLLGGWRDGAVGVVLAKYVSDMVYQKYLKARWDNLAG